MNHTRGESPKKSRSAIERPLPFYFLDIREVAFFEALCSTVVPEGEDPKTDPGAVTVGAVSYIDSTLFDFPKEVQAYFQGAVELVNNACRAKFRAEFADLSDSDRNIVLRDLYLDPLTMERMFDLRSLALEGFYSDYKDPWYAGVTAWQYIQFGGKRISDIRKDWTFIKLWKDWEEKQSKS
jgi:Gluconate 2-dehydrogenase subunit 3